jgi:hypothetical protein
MAADETRSAGHQGGHVDLDGKVVCPHKTTIGSNLSAGGLPKHLGAASRFAQPAQFR